MIIVTDTREQDPLDFQFLGIESERACLSEGDYSAKGQETEVVIERKSIPDLWGSFTGRSYKRERDKITRAREKGCKFILAIEGCAWTVRKGYQYWNGKELITHKKDGLSMMRQLMTISRKYNIEVWFCNSRQDMAFRIAEYLYCKDRGTI